MKTAIFWGFIIIATVATVVYLRRRSAKKSAGLSTEDKKPLSFSMSSILSYLHEKLPGLFNEPQGGSRKSSSGKSLDEQIKEAELEQQELEKRKKLATLQAKNDGLKKAIKRIR